MVWNAIAYGIGAVVFSALGLSAIWTSISNHNVQRRVIADAQHTSGTITDVGIRTDRSTETTTYVPFVEYEYESTVERLTGTNLYPGSGRVRRNFSRRKKAAAAIDAYEKGDRVHVYYDPEDPEHAFLEPTVQSGSNLVICLFGIVFSLVGVGLGFAALLQLV